MAGDQPEGGAAAPAAESSSLFGHVMGSIKHVVKTGVEKGEEIAHSPTTQRIAGQVSDAGKEALHKGQEIMQSPTTKRIAGQVAVAGEQVAQQHVNKVHGVIDAGKRGDVNGVIHNGLPLAAEILMPHAAAIAIVKDQGGNILMNNVPAEHRDTVRKIKGATDLATSKQALPNLVIHGVEQSDKSGKY